MSRKISSKDSDSDLDEVPELSAKDFAQSMIRRGLKPVTPKKQLTLRIDNDVIEWFRAQGPGYQTRINELLRAYMEAHQQ